MKKEQNNKSPVCPECTSKVILYRKRTNDYLCRRCGHTFSKTNGQSVNNPISTPHLKVNEHFVDVVKKINKKE